MVIKVATNSPESFEPSMGDFEFLDLHNAPPRVDVLLVLLGSPWGSKNLNKIQALGDRFAAFDRNVPLHIFGVRIPIPRGETHRLERFRHKDRDEAILNVLDPARLATGSIHVEDEVTHHFLTEQLGLDPAKIFRLGDLGFEALKNGWPKLALLERPIKSFVLRPYDPYVRPRNFEEKIFLGRPTKERIAGSAADPGDRKRVRLTAPFRIDGETKDLWVEVDARNSRYLLADRADAFLAALVPVALRLGKNIVSEAPVTPTLLHNLNSNLLPALVRSDYRLKDVRIEADESSKVTKTGLGRATAMSCGIDSFYTLSAKAGGRSSLSGINALYLGNYLYGNDGAGYDRAARAAVQSGHPLFTTRSNIHDVIRLPHKPTHFFKVMFGVLALRLAFNTYYYSTDGKIEADLTDNSVRSCAHYLPLLVQGFSTHELLITLVGGNSHRVEKTRVVAQMWEAQQLLNVCLNPNLSTNCGICGKCLRTQLTLEYLGVLERFSNVFDLEKYRDNRIRALRHLIKNQNSSYLQGVYQHFADHDPSLLAAARISD